MNQQIADCVCAYRMTCSPAPPTAPRPPSTLPASAAADRVFRSILKMHQGQRCFVHFLKCTEKGAVSAFSALKIAEKEDNTDLPLRLPRSVIQPKDIEKGLQMHQ